MSHSTLLDHAVTDRTATTLTGSLGLAVEKIAAEIAQETLRDEEFRRALHELVKRRAREILDDLSRPRPTPKKKKAPTA
jgi:hypothetical protein